MVLRYAYIISGRFTDLVRVTTRARPRVPAAFSECWRKCWCAARTSLQSGARRACDHRGNHRDAGPDGSTLL